VNALPKTQNGGQTVIEVGLHNEEMAEAVRAMLGEHYAHVIDYIGVADCRDGWILHVWLTDANYQFDMVGRIYLMLSVNGVIGTHVTMPSLAA
jgi:hypothetical protein